MKFSRSVGVALLMAPLVAVSAGGAATPSRATAALSGSCDLRAGAMAAAPQAGASWKAVAASGRVLARSVSTREVPWRPLRRGDAVAPLSQVRAFERARATFTRHGDLILVAPGGDVVLPDGDQADTMLIQQRAGKALYRVEPRSDGGRFEVHTPFLIAGVKGTQFSVLIEDGSAAVCVLEGHVQVRSLLTGETRDLFAGDVAVVDGRDERLLLYQESSGQPGSRRLEPDRQVAALSEETDELAETLERDQALLEGTEDSVWADLTGETESLTRDTLETTSKTTRLDPSSQEVKTDTTLLDAVPLLKKRTGGGN